MKDNANVLDHLNEFNSLFSQLTPKGLKLDDEMKKIFSFILFAKFMGHFLYNN